MSNSPQCPACGSEMRQRNGKHGQFWGCANYPDCKATLPGEGDSRGSSGGQAGAQAITEAADRIVAAVDRLTNAVNSFGQAGNEQEPF